MELTIKAKNRCIFCKKKIEIGENVCIYKTGIIIHQSPCKKKLDYLLKKDKENNV